jgi:RNA polymerase sigma factor (sigma-70 family)
MASAGTQPVAAQSEDPVLKALDDGNVRDSLVKHAMAILGRRLAGYPLTQRTDAANVAVQDVCVRALEKRHDYDPARAVGPWLHGIMANVLSETIRGVRRLPAQESADRDAWEKLAIDLTPDVAETAPSKLDAANYLAKLPVECRDLIELRFCQGLSHIEIAARLGISTANARVRLCRALSALRAIAGVALQEDRP